jgi:hypothetical protein
VQFRILDTHTKVAPDGENLFVRVDLMLEDDEHDVEPEEIVEWGAFGFLYALAALSFHDARPRGMSALDFEADDILTVADFMDVLSFNHNGLSEQADYLRGRSMKTDATIRPDGTVRLTTWGSGQECPALARSPAGQETRPGRFDRTREQLTQTSAATEAP